MALGREPRTRPQLAGRLARRHCRATAPDRAAALRILRRSHLGSILAGADLPRLGTLTLHPAFDRLPGPHRLPDGLRLLPDPRARASHAAHHVLWIGPN